MTGQTISHYRIDSKLGEGGMGVVYRGEDLKLGRAVALKFLGAHLLADADAKKRFLREAKAAASLQHPNICTVYEVDEVNGKLFLAMALVPGRPLEELVDEGPLPIDKAVEIARQIAEGLRVAHENGVVHRDVKPANILVEERDDGQLHATVMDFGLAQLAGSSRLTRQDTSLGTVSHMSPEQAMGGGSDRRTDIWALGVVLYQMVTGELPFKGEIDHAVTYSILNEDYEPVTAVRAGVPMDIEFIVGKCLAKDPAERYQNLAELIVDLKSLQKKSESGRAQRVSGIATRAQPIPPASTTKPDQRHRRMASALAVLLALALAVIGWLWSRTGGQGQAGPVRRFTIQPGENIGFAKLSPDGRYITYSAGFRDDNAWRLDLESGETTHLDWPDGSWGCFSPEGDSVMAVGGELKIFPRHGADVGLKLTDLPGEGLLGCTWSPDESRIVFATVPRDLPPRLFSVPAAGGEAELLFDPEDPADATLFPAYLPSEAGNLLLYGWGRGEYSPQAETELRARNLDTGETRTVAAAFSGSYSSSGHLIMQTFEDGKPVITASPFSLQRLAQTGRPIVVADDAYFSGVGADGALCYYDPPTSVEDQLVWRDRTGAVVGRIGAPQIDIEEPALSPDGRQVAVRGVEDQEVDIWIHSVDGQSKLRVSFDEGDDVRPVWLPDGKSISFTGARGKQRSVFVKRANGSIDVETFLDSSDRDYVQQWSRDGRYVLFDRVGEDSRGDLYYLERRSDGRWSDPIAFLDREADDSSAVLSPDSRFIAYQSDEGGKDHVYVSEFPSGANPSRISARDGSQPLWRADGKELFWVEDGALMAAEVSTTPSFKVGARSKLFTARSALRGRGRRYDAAADGQRFVLEEPLRPDGNPSIHIVQNWVHAFGAGE